MLLTAEDLEHALARMAGIPEVDTVRFAVPPDAFQVLRVREARLNDVVPLGAAEDRFFIASYTPTDESLRRRLCELTGRSVSLVWASRAAIRSRLDLQESAGAAGAANARNLPPLSMPGYARGATGPAATGEADIELLVSQALIEIASGQEHEEAASAAESSGMVRMVKKMIDDALAQEASDIHIETNPGEQITLIRFRRDGDLEPYLRPAGQAAFVAGVAHQDHVAGWTSPSGARPQDGKINYADFGGPQLELRVAVMPTHDGLEDVVPAPAGPRPSRFRSPSWACSRATRTPSSAWSVPHLWSDPEPPAPPDRARPPRCIRCSAEVNTGERKIWTAEDPIEITQPGPAPGAGEPRRSA